MKHETEASYLGKEVGVKLNKFHKYCELFMGIYGVCDCMFNVKVDVFSLG